MHPGGHKSSKRHHTTDNEDDDANGPKDPKKPTFIAMRVIGEDVNAAFGRDVEDNRATLNPPLTIMATKTLSICDAWIVDSGCA